jgi:hypothetical protein
VFRHLLQTEDPIDFAITGEIANPRDLTLSHDRASGRCPSVAQGRSSKPPQRLDVV